MFICRSQGSEVMRSNSYLVTALVVGGIALTFGTAAPTHASTDSSAFLDTLSARGVDVSLQSAPALRLAGLMMCTELNGGRSVQDVAERWQNPAATQQELYDIASAARQQLCPSTA